MIQDIDNNPSQERGVDFIGDVHGHADELERLLVKLGYKEAPSGVWQHPIRTVAFVGDLIDRGPDQLRVLDIARGMQKEGSAAIVMGNHEFNAVAWMTEAPESPGTFQRDRTKIANQEQHAEFLRQVGDGSPLHVELVGWMRSLPLWLDTDGYRVVHACWHPPSIEALTPFCDRLGVLSAEGWDRALRKSTAEYDAIEVILKGLEIELPHGVSFLDKGGHERREARIKWWDPRATTIRQAALCDDDARQQLPDTLLMSGQLVPYDMTKPVFFGHYWLNEPVPTLICDKRACLDYSVAKGGKLIAYRWSGEAVLDAANLVFV